MIITFRIVAGLCEISLTTSPEEILSKREKWLREASVLLAKEMLANGLISVAEGPHPARDVREYKAYLSFGQKEIRLP